MTDEAVIEEHRGHEFPGQGRWGLAYHRLGDDRCGSS
jgi:hypothetical protein